MAPLLVLEHATKSFGAVQALEDGSIELQAGEAHALIGENGAGKSTLVKILAGVHRPDSGRLLLDGRELRLANPADARDAGIAVIYQEPTLFPDLSVAENIFMGRQPLTSGRRIDGGEMRRQVEALMERLGVPLDPNRPARGLSIADQQIVEIAKALSFEARVIVMDEPTAALSGAEVERLFTVARTLQEHGAAVLFVSHRLDEVFALCQRVTIMRDGRHRFSGPLAGLTNDDLVSRMVGRELPAASPPAAMAAGLGFVPEDRREQGLIMDLSIARNASLASLRRLRRGLLIHAADEQRLAADWATRLRLKFAHFSDPVSVLSGGNQQKVVLAKWLARKPTVLIVDEPTRGIDVGTKAEVHRLLSDLAGQGVAVLMISSELPEILGMADRVLVMHEGRLTAELSRDEATEQTVMLAATGQPTQAAS